MSITQYNNGTLLLQGKDDELFSNTCDHIEKIATPSDQEVISRFISGDEEALRIFTSKYTPEISILAEKELRDKLDLVFDFLQPYDQKWLIASQIFKNANLPLPEYSPIVMPSAKAFEGFVKKILVATGFYPSDHFKSKTAKFDYLIDSSNAHRKLFVAKEKYADTILKDINVSLERYRNFMMHSDDNINTKVETFEEGVKILDEIHDKIKSIYKYFKTNTIFGL